MGGTAKHLLGMRLRLTISAADLVVSVTHSLISARGISHFSGCGPARKR
jgi:hypothetical protein